MVTLVAISLTPMLVIALLLMKGLVMLLMGFLALALLSKVHGFVAKRGLALSHTPASLTNPETTILSIRGESFLLKRIAGRSDQDQWVVDGQSCFKENCRGCFPEKLNFLKLMYNEEAWVLSKKQRKEIWENVSRIQAKTSSGESSQSRMVPCMIKVTGTMRAGLRVTLVEPKLDIIWVNTNEDVIMVDDNMTDVGSNALDDYEKAYDPITPELENMVMAGATTLTTSDGVANREFRMNTFTPAALMGIGGATAAITEVSKTVLTDTAESTYHNMMSAGVIIFLVSAIVFILLTIILFTSGEQVVRMTVALIIMSTTSVMFLGLALLSTSWSSWYDGPSLGTLMTIVASSLGFACTIYLGYSFKTKEMAYMDTQPEELPGYVSAWDRGLKPLLVLAEIILNTKTYRIVVAVYIFTMLMGVGLSQEVYVKARGIEHAHPEDMQYLITRRTVDWNIAEVEWRAKAYALKSQLEGLVMYSSLGPFRYGDHTPGDGYPLELEASPYACRMGSVAIPSGKQTVNGCQCAGKYPLFCPLGGDCVEEQICEGYGTVVTIDVAGHFMSSDNARLWSFIDQSMTNLRELWEAHIGSPLLRDDRYYYPNGTFNAEFREPPPSRKKRFIIAATAGTALSLCSASDAGWCISSHAVLENFESYQQLFDLNNENWSDQLSINEDFASLFLATAAEIGRLYNSAASANQASAVVTSLEDHVYRILSELGTVGSLILEKRLSGNVPLYDPAAHAQMAVDMQDTITDELESRGMKPFFTSDLALSSGYTWLSDQGETVEYLMIVTVPLLDSGLVKSIVSDGYISPVWEEGGQVWAAEVPLSVMKIWDTHSSYKFDRHPRDCLGDMSAQMQACLTGRRTRVSMTDDERLEWNALHGRLDNPGLMTVDSRHFPKVLKNTEEESTPQVMLLGDVLWMLVPPNSNTQVEGGGSGMTYGASSEWELVEVAVSEPRKVTVSTASRTTTLNMVIESRNGDEYLRRLSAVHVDLPTVIKESTAGESAAGDFQDYINGRISEVLIYVDMIDQRNEESRNITENLNRAQNIFGNISLPALSLFGSIIGVVVLIALVLLVCWLCKNGGGGMGASPRVTIQGLPMGRL